MERQRFRRLYLEYRGLIVFVVLMAVFRSALADWNEVPTGSMLPTIREGDRIYVDKLAYDLRVPLTHQSLYRFAEPQRGDIIVFDSRQAGVRLVKRVIGLPGDVVALRDNRLSINGRNARYRQNDADDASLATTLIEELDDMRHGMQLSGAHDALERGFGPVRVPEGHFLVLGDNRDNSADSRVHGFVPRDEIVGRARSVVVSLDYDRYYLPRADRFMKPLD